MASFSERNGYRKTRDIAQFETMDDDLRVSIYNELYSWLDNAPHNQICREVWTVLWHLPIDKFPYYAYDFHQELKKMVCKGQWFEPYDLIEFVAQELFCEDEDNASRHSAFYGHAVSFDNNSELEDFIVSINEVLEREKSAYRLVNTSIVPITNSAELASVNNAMEHHSGFEGARRHFERALECFSRKPEADYPNTIKEAISAVESAAEVLVVSKDASLGKALDKLKERGIIHPSLAKGWGALYGFTSNEGGIRHASYDGEIKADFALAEYMLVSCSAFVNYLAEAYSHLDK